MYRKAVLIVSSLMLPQISAADEFLQQNRSNAPHSIHRSHVRHQSKYSRYDLTSKESWYNVLLGQGLEDKLMANVCSSRTSRSHRKIKTLQYKTRNIVGSPEIRTVWSIGQWYRLSAYPQKYPSIICYFGHHSKIFTTITPYSHI